MGLEAEDFGALLRRWRLARGMSLGRLAEVVHYTKGHLSNVEHGHKQPSELLARLCDGHLGAGGELVGHSAVLRPSSTGRHHTASAPLDLFFDSPWALRVSPDGSGWFDATGVSHPLTRPSRSGQPIVEEQWALFGAIRSFGRTASPSDVLKMALMQFQTIRSGIKAAADGKSSRQLVLVGAHLAEYCGWMWQEAGHDEAALTWTDWAVDLAREAHDTEMGEYAGARRALVMLYRREARQVIELVGRVPASVSPRVRWLSAMREAQGHALAGDRDACLRALDRARGLHENAVGEADDRAVLGPAGRIDRLGAVTGWCLYDLGLPAQAVEALEPAVAAMPRHTRDYPRFGARLALAYVAAGDLARGCALMDDLVERVVQVDSATIRTDVRAFGHLIERHHLDPAAGRIRQRLSLALHS